MVLFWRLVGSFGAISAISSLIIVISYLLLPKLRRHPTSLIFWLSVCDFILSVRYTLTSVIPNSRSVDFVISAPSLIMLGGATSKQPGFNSGHLPLSLGMG
jgi:hypothetical protein